MRIAKWGDSLAVRLPAAVVEELELKEGDEIEIQAAVERQLTIARKPGREDLLAGCMRSGVGSPLVSSSTVTRQMPNSFFDTNVIIYAASADPLKAAKAAQLITGGGAISVQVLNEIANVTRRKMHKPWAEIREFLATLRGLLTVHPVTAGVHETGLAWRSATALPFSMA